MANDVLLEVPRLIAETGQWVVVHKPAGWLSIPGSPGAGSVCRSGSGSPAGIVSDWARRRFGAVWTVHRLDLETSGVLLFARSAESHKSANEWFSSHRVRKTYECLAAGEPGAPMFRIQNAIRGSACATLVEVRSRLAGCFLARVMPLTGRRHQIRIHFSGEGHPLLGDVRYGGPCQVRTAGGIVEIARVALHAAKLELPTLEKFEAEWPPDFSGWVSALRSEGKSA